MYRTTGKNLYAFTIIEVIFMVVIIALLTILGTFGIYQRLDTTKVKADTLALKRAARFARLMAGQFHRPCTLHFELESRIWWLEMLDAPQPVTASSSPSEAPPAPELQFENAFAQKQQLNDIVAFQRIKTDETELLEKGSIVIRFEIDGSAQPALIQLGSTQSDSVYTLVISPWTARATIVAGPVPDLPMQQIDLEKTRLGDNIFK